MKIPEYNVYELSYDDTFPTSELFLRTFGKIPSRYQTKTKYNVEVVNYFLQNGFKKISKITKNKESYIGIKYSEFLFLENINDKIFCLIFINDDGTKNLNCDLEFYYDYGEGDITNQISFDELDIYKKIKNTKSKISLIRTIGGGMLDLEEFDINVGDVNLSLNYGKNFEVVHDNIVNRLNTLNDKGIVLLHGTPGSGKTTYIKYLTSLINEKQIIFIPPSMSHSLADPSIIPFLMDNKNSILIIEDAEKVIADREINGSSEAVSNILNLTDGILGDCLSIQIIATFNMEKEKIDSALLRPGRLIAEHKFDKLSVDDSNTLLSSLELEYITDKEMTLAEIYNINKQQYKVVNKQNKIGLV